MTDSTEGASGADTTMTTTQQHDPALTPSMDVLGQLPVGVMLMDADGAVVHRNDALQAMWGDLVHRPAEAPFPSDAYGPDGVPMDADDWPIRRSLATGDELRDISIELDRPDDAPVSIVAESRPLVDPRGRRVGAVMVVRDVSREHDQAMLRQAFAGILSHELRTPVTSIYSGIELLRAHRLSEPVTRDVLNDVAVEAETLHRLIEDLLVMVRLERGVSMALPEPILVHRIVGLALADEARRWPDRTFVADIPADLPTAQGDEGLLRQVLRNLLSNAAKYGPRSGTVRITAAAVPDGLTVTVSDEGPGIDDDQRDRVFELFDRAGTSARIPGLRHRTVRRPCADGSDGRDHRHRPAGQGRGVHPPPAALPGARGRQIGECRHQCGSRSRSTAPPGRSRAGTGEGPPRIGSPPERRRSFLIRAAPARTMARMRRPSTHVLRVLAATCLAMAALGACIPASSDGPGAGVMAVDNVSTDTIYIRLDGASDLGVIYRIDPGARGRVQALVPDARPARLVIYAEDCSEISQEPDPALGQLQVTGASSYVSSAAQLPDVMDRPLMPVDDACRS